MSGRIAVIGAGAAGLFAALAARGALGEDGSVGPAADDAPEVLLFDGQAAPGKKILISGGGRCNLTNAAATFTDYLTDEPKRVRSILRGFEVEATLRCFDQLGVPSDTEPMGKVFPRSGRARDVVEALMAACDRAGVAKRFGEVVDRIVADDDGWQVDGEAVDRVVLATGGRSVPKTGSTGFGYALAEDLGHALVPTVPALAPLLGDVPTSLAGITVPAVVRVVDRADGRERVRAAGSLLFTHKGVTGPAALDVSHEVEHAARESREVRVLIDLWSLAAPDGPFAEHLGAPKLPGSCLADPPAAIEVAELDRWLQEAADAESHLTLAALLQRRLPKRLVAELVPDGGDVLLGQLPKDVRRATATTLSAFDLQVTGTGGYAKAEVTAGGIPLSELSRRTLESQVAPGLYACGEVCDCTGRLGGFNFQWAWASGFLAGRSAAASLGA